jgi:hypothetical protein
MTRLSCPGCRLRFDAAATASLATCPECGRPVEAVGSAEATLGYCPFVAHDPQPALPMVAEAAMPIPGLLPDRP